MSELVLVMSITAILFAGVGMVFSFLSYAKVVGMEKSTHRLQYVPMEEGLSGKELVTKMKDTLYPDDEEEYV